MSKPVHQKIHSSAVFVEFYYITFTPKVLVSECACMVDIIMTGKVVPKAWNQQPQLWFKL